MNIVIGKTRISLLLAAGLLVLAGFLSDGRPAAAQSQIDCPLPAGVTPPANPAVTAQQVEDGSASLMDFALAVRDQNNEISQSSTTVEQVAYLGCLVRQEGSAWRSGSTYLVQLTPDGRILVHAQDMSLSGGQLNPLIYAAILQALGINPAALTDPAAAAAAFAAATAGNGGQFAVPDIPGASGYAYAYRSANFRTPLVMLAGFDLDRSHLAEEDIDYGNPTITARDVVDRATLKAFVTQAGGYLLELYQSGDLAASSKARIALRDPNGPWIHGSVYVAVLDPASRLILFHGGFPDRFELRQGGIATDTATGELVVDQLIRAANSSPEGGFWTYYFDNPADDTDSAEVPKVGYARLFTAQVPLPDGTIVQSNFIVNSGFYLGSPGVAAASRNTVVKSVLPQVMRAMTASTVDAISGRVQQSTSDDRAEAGFTLGGASTLTDALLANRQALETGRFDVSRLLSDSSFTLPLNAAGSKGRGPLGNLTLWGSGDYRNFSGGNRRSVSYGGNVVSGNVGVDTRLRADLLAGLAVSVARGAVDYTDSNAQAGELTTTLTSINPYVGWQAPGGMNLWAAAGYGWGEVQIEDSTGTQASDLTQKMFVAGANGPLYSTDEAIPGGTTILRLKGETAFTWADVDGSRSLASASMNVSRQRLMLEGSHVQKLASGATLAPSVEIGARIDGGDGETGTSLEIGGGLRYADRATGLTVEGRARTLLLHSGDYEEWGVSGLVRIDPGRAGLGLALSVQPVWGQAASGTQRLWETDVTRTASTANRSVGRLNARIAYGIGTASDGRSVLTPYTDMSLSGAGSHRLSLGGRFDIGTSVRMNLEGVRSQPARGEAVHSVMLRGDLRW